MNPRGRPERGAKRNLPVLVKTFGKDLRSYRELQRDLLKHGHVNTHVCVPERDLAAFAEILAPGFTLIAAEALLRHYGWPFGLGEDWYSQQLLKLLLVVSSPAEASWVIDANTLLLEPLPDPWVNGRVVLRLGHLNSDDQDWYASSAAFLRLDPRGLPLDAVNQPMRRNVVVAILARITAIYAHHPVDTLVAGIFRARAGSVPTWTEYGLYRAAATHLVPESHTWEAGNPVGYYFHHPRADAREARLAQLRSDRPGMVKVYAQRPSYRMTDDELQRVCERIRVGARDIAERDFSRKTW